MTNQQCKEHAEQIVLLNQKVDIVIVKVDEYRQDQKLNNKYTQDLLSKTIKEVLSNNTTEKDKLYKMIIKFIAILGTVTMAAMALFKLV